MSEDRHDRDGYEPPEVCDIDAADDRELVVAPGTGGSPDAGADG